MLQTPVVTSEHGERPVGEFEIGAGDHVPFRLAWYRCAGGHDHEEIGALRSRLGALDAHLERLERHL